jgi:TRAP-type C4-dicarboxylate transport system permease small subunit
MRNKVDFFLGRFLTFIMAILTIVVLWGVFTRYALNSQASWSEELARFLLIWLGILGAAYASGQHLHLSIDLLSPKLNDRNKKRLSLLIDLLIIAFALSVLVIGGFRLIYISQQLGQLSPALRIPMWMVYAVVPISGCFVIYFKINRRMEGDFLTATQNEI